MLLYKLRNMAICLMYGSTYLALPQIVQKQNISFISDILNLIIGNTRLITNTILKYY